MSALERLEANHIEAEAALESLKASWAAEDEALAASRAAMLEAHAQGARDRDAERVRLGGVSVLGAPDGEDDGNTAETAESPVAETPTAPEAA